jgi:valyl-tRNA synthetase
MNLIFNNILIMLHPTIPFVSEQIYQNLYKYKKSIMIENYPNEINNKFSLLDKKTMNIILDIFKFIKNLRIKHNLKLSQKISINLITIEKIDKDYLNNMLQVCNSEIKVISENRVDEKNAIHSTSNCLIEYLEDFVNKKNQLDNLNKQLANLENEIKRSKSILANKNFINKAPSEKVNLEKQKYENYLKQHQEVLEAIKLLKNH